MIEQLTRKLFLPAHERLRGRETLCYYERLLESQKQSRENILQDQKNKLLQLLSHCIDKVPYYSNIMEHMEINGLDECSLDSYKKLPVLEKEPIRENLDKFITKDYQGKLIKYSTGGSTGEPLVFYTDVHKESKHKAHDWRCRNWFGVKPGDRQVDFWGSPIELNKQSKLRKWKDHYLLNHIVLPAFEMGEEKIFQYVNLLKKYRPRLIYGYPSILNIVAQYIHSTKFNLNGYKPKLISCTSEMLYQYQRENIQDVFDCDVVSEYGARDGGLIAHECTEGNYHIAAEHVYVEVNDPDADGIGDLLITNLDGFGMPLLRYKIGDRGSLSDLSCACGLPFPLLGDLLGRSNDILVGKNGKPVHGLSVVYAMRKYRQILKQFRVIQRKDSSLVIQLVGMESFNESDRADIRQKMNQIFEFDVPVKFEAMDNIPVEPSGKLRTVICEMENT